MFDDNKPRLIGRKEAAAYCGVSPTCFSMWVASHKMPPAVPGTRKWDRKAIDARLDEISGLGESEKEDPYVREMRRLNLSSGQSSEPEKSPFDEWREGKLKRRQKYAAQLGLDANLKRVLQFIGSHPDCRTTDVVPGAGPAVISKLIAVGALKRVDGEADVEFELTDTGRAELHRYKKWAALTP